MIHYSFIHIFLRIPIVLCNSGQILINQFFCRWPPGLSMLETRQSNRHRYEEFVTKRIPNKQAIVLMACENEHMGDSMMRDPGFVIIFAHGVDL